MPSEDIIAAQEQFIQQGGLFQEALRKKRAAGELPKSYVFNEYPKDIRISEGVQEFKMSTETVDKRRIEWTENREVFRTVTVYSEEEEEQVQAGGMTHASLEDERQALILRCRNLGIKVDPTWTTIRLKRELGDKLDAPEPTDKMAALKRELEQLQEIARMQAEIERLRAQVAKPADDADTLREELAGLGIVADKRWGVARLREELDKATAPQDVAA